MFNCLLDNVETIEDVFTEFGSDKSTLVCNKCENLTYENGMLTCELLKKKGEQ